MISKSLVILNYNSTALSIELSTALLSILDDSYVLIIVDNHSRDVDKLETFVGSNFGKVFSLDDLSNVNHLCERVILIKSNFNLGYSMGNNLGLKLSWKLGYSIAYVVNPDVVVNDIGVLRRSEELIKSYSDIGIVGCKVILPNGVRQGPFKYDLGWDALLRNISFPIYTLYREIKFGRDMANSNFITVPAVVGCFLAFDLEKLNLVNYYDEEIFLYYEEYIISDKMRKNGFRTVYFDSHSVLHNHIYTKSESVIGAEFGLKSKKYYLKNYKKMNWLFRNIYAFSEIYFNLCVKLLKYIGFSSDKK